MSAEPYSEEELKYLNATKVDGFFQRFLATISAKDAEILDMSNSYYALKLELHEKDTEIERLKDLVMRAYFDGRFHRQVGIEIDNGWQNFCKQNSITQE